MASKADAHFAFPSGVLQSQKPKFFKVLLPLGPLYKMLAILPDGELVNRRQICPLLLAMTTSPYVEDLDGRTRLGLRIVRDN